MDTIVIFTIMLICSAITAVCFWYAMRHRPPLANPLPFIQPPWRNLLPEEHNTIKYYLDSLSRHQTTDNAATLMLDPRNSRVYPVTRAITRYGLTTDDPQKWRYYLDEMEVHLPPLWEQYIAEVNFLELVKTQTVPLVISLNGHTLADYPQQPDISSSFTPSAIMQASLHNARSEIVELIQIRKETAAEYFLAHSGNILDALVVNSALLMFFISLIIPPELMLWAFIAGVLLLFISLWLMYRQPDKRRLREIHCLRGTPKRWGIFSETNPGQINAVSLGIIDLIHPLHWQPFITHDLGHTTDIDMYLNHQVVHQGRFLSLQTEMHNFPLASWQKNAVLAGGSLLILALLITWIPLDMPVKLSIAWLKGSESIRVNNPGQLKNTPLHVGDKLKVSGTGKCSVPTHYQSNRTYAFMPFDCSAIYWNPAAPQMMPQSTIIERASALLASINQQLYGQRSITTGLSPHLVSAIQKSGMILLDDFADLVQKTQNLCRMQQDCIRLKNALVNLGNAGDWLTLVNRAESGSLDKMNVLLRPVSAEALENLVNVAISPFFYREAHRITKTLNTSPAGGFLIINDEGKPLVNHPQPTVPLFDYSAPEQWQELQRLTSLLLHTPFHASGVITHLNTGVNGTLYVTLHSEPPPLLLWRYLGTTLLLLVLSLNMLVNILLMLKGFHRNRIRIAKIQQYYESCFNDPAAPELSSPFTVKSIH